MNKQPTKTLPDILAAQKAKARSKYIRGRIYELKQKFKIPGGMKLPQARKTRKLN
jgi:hypothetical protein